MTNAERWCRTVLDLMETAFRRGHAIALDDAVMFCHKSGVRLPEFVFEELIRRGNAEWRGKKLKKPIGRHAQSREQQIQILFDAKCFKVVNALRRNKALTSDEMYDLARKQLRVEASTVLKAYYRHRDRMASGKYYVSLRTNRNVEAFFALNKALLGL